MEKILLSFVLFPLIRNNCTAQDTTGITKDTTIITDSLVAQPIHYNVPTKLTTEKSVYKLKLGADIPVTLIGAGWCGYAFTKIYSKEPLTLEELQRLNPNNVNSFDRPGIDHYNENAVKIGDDLFYGSMPLPILLLADKKMRKDLPELILLYLEAMSVTGIPYTASVYFADRYRPYTYNESVPLDFRLRGGSRNSFFAGHPALVGTATFFMATVYADYHPDSKIKWVFFTVASAATLGTSVCRYLGGRHFLSDLIIGTALGPLSGILIPRWHKNKEYQKKSTTVLPYFGRSVGLTMVHKF
jgi:membrane-associated phospholipid phosphatase